jgi:hypothetical protein
VPLLLVAFVLGLVFLWTFSAALKAPTSFMAVADERTRIRFAGFVDLVVANQNIVSARLKRHRFLAGIGIRTNFGGDVALITLPGEVVELTFREPVRVWLVPRLIPLRAHRLSLSLLHPARVVERFAPAAPVPSPPPNAHARRMKRRGSRTR